MGAPEKRVEIARFRKCGDSFTLNCKSVDFKEHRRHSAGFSLTLTRNCRKRWRGIRIKRQTRQESLTSSRSQTPFGNAVRETPFPEPAATSGRLSGARNRVSRI